MPWLMVDPSERDLATGFVVMVDEPATWLRNGHATRTPCFAQRRRPLSREVVPDGLKTLIFDIDSSVREAAARACGDLQPTNANREATEAALRTPPELWTCTRCGDRSP